jgi:hypothetical protein
MARDKLTVVPIIGETLPVRKEKPVGPLPELAVWGTISGLTRFWQFPSVCGVGVRERSWYFRTSKK